MLLIQNILHQWYKENKRDLPWRHTQDAYRIWISEIMLQQTQVKQGLPYYLRFMENFISVKDLAEAKEDDVLKLWQGLGYYSRARNLHFAAKQVMAEYNGVFPTKYDDLIKLKGVGDYTASAVSAFSSGEARACIDGNVIRVICRLFGVDIPYDTGEGKKAIRLLADELLYQKDSALHNQSIMEFGALQCTPKSPKCDTCPARDVCVAFADKKVLELPIKSKKVKVKDLFLYYFVFQQEDNILIQQRSDSGIWKNMYEFPILESETMINEEQLLMHLSKFTPSTSTTVNDPKVDTYTNKDETTVSFSQNYTHILSHRKIQATFIHVKTNKLPQTSKGVKIKMGDFNEYPVSRLIERFWETFI